MSGCRCPVPTEAQHVEVPVETTLTLKSMVSPWLTLIYVPKPWSPDRPRPAPTTVRRHTRLRVLADDRVAVGASHGPVAYDGARWRDERNEHARGEHDTADARADRACMAVLPSPPRKSRYVFGSPGPEYTFVFSFFFRDSGPKSAECVSRPSHGFAHGIRGSFAVVGGKGPYYSTLDFWICGLSV